MPGDGAVVLGERGECCEVVAAAASDGQRRREAAGAQATALAGGRAGVAARAAGRYAGRDVRRLVVELGERGVATSYGSVWRIVREAGITFKKTLFATERDRPAVARRREQWRKYQGRLDPRRLVFIDETWASTNMTPIRGWSQRSRKRGVKAAGYAACAMF